MLSRNNRARRVSAAAFFGERATYYDSQYDARNVDGHALRARATATLRLAGRGPGESLDAGMGPGRLCAALQEQGWTVTGIDASPEMVDTARQRLLRPRATGCWSHDRRATVLRRQVRPCNGGGCPRVLQGHGRARGALSGAAARGPGGVELPQPRGLLRNLEDTRVVPRSPNCEAHAPPFRSEHAARLRPHPPGHVPCLLANANLTAQASLYTSFSPLPAPIDQLLPRTSQRLGAMLEGRGGRTARLLATQVVYSARLDPGERSGREQGA